MAGTDQDMDPASAGSDGGNNNKSDPSPPASMDLSKLKEKFQGAVAMLQRERPQATVVKDPVDVQDNDDPENSVLIWLGEFNLQKQSERWDNTTAEIYIIVDQSFDRSDPHWVLMAPAVTVDGQDANNISERNAMSPEHEAHGEKAELAIKHSDENSALAFSWRWSKMGEQPEEYRDLVKAPQLVKYLLTLKSRRDAT